MVVGEVRGLLQTHHAQSGSDGATTGCENCSHNQDQNVLPRWCRKTLGERLHPFGQPGRHKPARTPVPHQSPESVSGKTRPQQISGESQVRSHSIQLQPAGKTAKVQLIYRRTTRGSRSRPSRRAAPSSRRPGWICAEILCVQEDRVVGNDNCVSFLNRKLQIPESPLRPHFVKATVTVHRYPTAAWLFSMVGVASAATTAKASQSANLAWKATREDRRSTPPSGSRRAQGRQGRFAPRRRGDLAFGEAIPDSPSARRALTRQVGSGKWS